MISPVCLSQSTVVSRWVERPIALISEITCPFAVNFLQASSTQVLTDSTISTGSCSIHLHSGQCCHCAGIGVLCFYRPGVRVHLSEFHLMRSYWTSRAVKDEEARTRRSLINGTNEPLFELFVVLYADLCIFAVFRDIARLRRTCRPSHGAVQRTMGRKLGSTLATGKGAGRSRREGEIIGK